MYVDGQVLVMHDMLGINKNFKILENQKSIEAVKKKYHIEKPYLGINKEFNPRFLRRYLNLYDQILDATKHYIEDVKSGDFPNEQEQY